jgi:SAM-dependent methyltransferase
MLADEALEKLLADYRFRTVLDVGCGQGHHTRAFRAAGKQVTGIDFRAQLPGVIEAAYEDYDFGGQFDCVWLSHVLEHQLNVHTFLKKAFHDLREGGPLAVTVPPLKHDIVGGHLSLWNPGLLLYHLVLAGFDCSEARLKQYGYNISVIVPRRAVPPAVHQTLRFANGDIEQLARFFPGRDPSRWRQGFRGDFSECQWASLPRPSRAAG